MKQFYNNIFIAFLLVITTGNTFSQDSRALNFNEGWRFYKGDGKDFQKISHDDNAWRSVDLPHDWSIEGPFSNQWASATGYLPGGIGWYRKSFTLSAKQRAAATYIYFDGVYKNSEVWINDHYLGKRPNGFVSFYYDLSPYLKTGTNTIAVRVDHTDFADSRWYTGSGINRNVYLLQLDAVHIDIWGQTFRTPQVTKEKATAEVLLQIKNTSTKAKQGTVSVELLRHAKVVATAQTTVSLNASGINAAKLNFNIENPELWSPDNPALYVLKTTIKVSGATVDVLTETVGFRYFAFDANKGFTINGVNTKLKGVCFHDDAGALGSAVPAAVWESRLKVLKEMGCNAIRMSHNPHQDYLYELCDRFGFFVQDEAFDEWAIGKNKWIAGWNVGTPGKDGTHVYFDEWSDRDLTDMIRRNKNHVSIIMWSIGNEIDYPNDPYTHEVLNTGRNPQIYGKGFQPGNPEAKQLGEIAKRLAQTAKKADPTRPVTAALAGVVMSNETTYPDQLDIVGYNYQEYRYEDDHKAYPNRVIYGSENGKNFEAWKAVLDHEFIAGQFLWTAFDFLGEARSWPSRSSGAGLIDMAGYPKPGYYHRKALWSHEPTVFCAVSRQTERAPLETHWNWQPGDSLNVVCFANTEEVELTINGLAVGKQVHRDHPDGTFSWKIKYAPGEVKIVGRNNNVEVSSYTMTTAGAPEKIFLETDRKAIRIHPDSIVQIAISLVDKNGLKITNAEAEVALEISGPGKLLGIESGSLDSHKNYQSPKRKTLNGKLIAYIRATDEGKIGVAATSAKMISNKIEITTTK
jgi:beta-galactosidase